ncbi:hypothetical protein CPLU01_07621 [Colletotrichum plurivorum]|uniref:Uncharacterized protein n=1 Tax=Colletotrichum plurivorum TaxID=2175906 RepID=A0A8H6KFY8_9PEZI|nr:hypothetical protein CPLU01_07621 [Colletotrichum plurivorum]
MSTVPLTARERLALAHWVYSQKDAPTAQSASAWVKENLGKDATEASIETVLCKEGLRRKGGYVPYNKRDIHHGLPAWDDGEITEMYRPGFGAPIDCMPEHTFPRAVDDWSAATLTYSELAMLGFMEEITNKPDWHAKVFNEEIVAKWKAELLAFDWTATDLEHAYIDDAMFEWCVQELREKAKLYEATGMVPIFDATAAVVKSDTAVTPDIKTELKEAVAALENVADAEKDWHPGSDEKVLDLVHPSLWPLAYGVSRVLADKRISLQDTLSSCGAGVVAPKPERNFGKLWSTKFQWLPCEVDLDDDKPRITSYVNNLHPHRHAALYKVIEKVIAKALPLWDVVYKWPQKFETQRIKVEQVERECQTPGACEERGWCNSDARPQEPDEEPRDEDLFEEFENRWPDQPEPDNETWRRDKAWFERTHPVKRHTVPEYRPMLLRPEDIKLDKGFLDDTARIQVIVKLANIHLTPDKPTYDGGSWHIEGLLNEHICATALYYYDNENITDSHLSFRTSADQEDMMMELSYEQGDYYSIERTFQIDATGDTLQELGSVLTREDRLLAFPNVYQHRVLPFELADKTRPGHRKILALFLVDPAIPVISTANVPPQQKHWWRDEVNSGRLPPEIVDMVFDNMDVPIGLEKAKEMRLELMKERTVIQDATMNKLKQKEWNFCEH